jgi:hypothetical protein
MQLNAQPAQNGAAHAKAKPDNDQTTNNHCHR